MPFTLWSFLRVNSEDRDIGVTVVVDRTHWNQFTHVDRVNVLPENGDIKHQTLTTIDSL